MDLGYSSVDRTVSTPDAIMLLLDAKKCVRGHSGDFVAALSEYLNKPATSVSPALNKLFHEGKIAMYIQDRGKAHRITGAALPGVNIPKADQLFLESTGSRLRTKFD